MQKDGRKEILNASVIISFRLVVVVVVVVVVAGVVVVVVVVLVVVVEVVVVVVVVEVVVVVVVVVVVAVVVAVVVVAAVVGVVVDCISKTIATSTSASTSTPTATPAPTPTATATSTSSSTTTCYYYSDHDIAATLPWSPEHLRRSSAGQRLLGLAGSPSGRNCLRNMLGSGYYKGFSLRLYLGPKRYYRGYYQGYYEREGIEGAVVMPSDWNVEMTGV